ncbi:MAG: hypothetical protein FWD97_10285 [Defluviitaleaceae bacterium]|nr:hypothetical protein [Defluviitaleaceae bacterium]
MENQDTNNKINHRSMMQTDAWTQIFDLISRLVTIEENLYGKNVYDLQELYDFAEEIERRTLGLVKPKLKVKPLRLCAGNDEPIM